MGTPDKTSSTTSGFVVWVSTPQGCPFRINLFYILQNMSLFDWIITIAFVLFFYLNRLVIKEFSGYFRFLNLQNDILYRLVFKTQFEMLRANPGSDEFDSNIRQQCVQHIKDEINREVSEIFEEEELETLIPAMQLSMRSGVFNNSYPMYQVFNSEMIKLAELKNSSAKNRTNE